MFTKQHRIEQIATWAGFHYEGHIGCAAFGWVAPNGFYYGRQLPNFLESVDMCLTWLMPKLKVVTMTNGYKGWVVSLNMGDIKGKPVYIGEHDKLAMAFCLAVEQLIDDEVK